MDTEAVNEAWADALVEGFSEFQPATVHRNIGALRGLFKFAHRRRWTRNNPFADLELPEKRQGERVQLTLSELNMLEGVAHLLARKAHRPMMRALFLTQFAIGTRVTELLALRVHDLDFGAGIVRVRRGKGAKPREIPLGERASAALREWLQVRAEWLTTRRGDPKIRGEEPEQLRLADRGRPRSPAGLTRLYDELAGLAGLKVKFRTHDLRALTAQSWKRRGVDPQIIQLWLGHSSQSTTKIYTRDAAPDTRRWAPFCDLPSADGTVVLPAVAAPLSREQQAGRDTSRIPLAAPSVPDGPVLVQLLQALETAQQQILLQRLLASALVAPVAAASVPAPAQPFLTEVLLAIAGLPSQR